jgi:hypothetical protein
MRTRLVIGGALAAVVLGATGVGVAVAGSGGNGTPGSGSGYGAPAGPASPSTPSAATVTNRTTNLGPTLADGTGRTLYLFRSDTPTTSTLRQAAAADEEAAP